MHCWRTAGALPAPKHNTNKLGLSLAFGSLQCRRLAPSRTRRSWRRPTDWLETAEHSGARGLGLAGHAKLCEARAGWLRRRSRTDWPALHLGSARPTRLASLGSTRHLGVGTAGQGGANCSRVTIRYGAGQRGADAK